MRNLLNVLETAAYRVDASDVSGALRAVRLLRRDATGVWLDVMGSAEALIHARRLEDASVLLWIVVGEIERAN